MGGILARSAGVMKYSGGSGCICSGGSAHSWRFSCDSVGDGLGNGCCTIWVGGWYSAGICSCRAGVPGLSLVCAHLMLEDWCVMRYRKMHSVQLVAASLEHEHRVVMGVVG